MSAGEEKIRVGKWVREVREASGLDRDVFAGRIGVSSHTLRNVEQGQQMLGKAAIRHVESFEAEIRGRGSYDQPKDPAPADLAETIARYVIDDRLREQAAEVARVTGLPLVEAVEMLVRQRLKK